jgi:catechol 2,3-dioxygenase-like lactoylglutathione lyase family enzyme
MRFIPILNVRTMADAVRFYTTYLDFEVAGVFPPKGDPAYALLRRDGADLHLSSHAGDGAAGQAIMIPLDDLDELYARYRGRGLPESPRTESPVHVQPTDQTWGTREFYVEDPSGNTLRFVQKKSWAAASQKRA